MSGAVQQQPPGWWCFRCALLKDVEYHPASRPDVHCGSCGEIANACAVLRIEVQALREALSSVLAPPSGAGAGEAKMTPAEAAAYLKLPSVRALYQAVRRGQVPVHRLGSRRMRFARADLEAVLARR